MHSPKQMVCYVIRCIAGAIPPSSLKAFIYGLTGIKMGKRVHISPGVYFADACLSGLVELEDEVVLSPKAIIIASSHPNTSFIAREYSVSKRKKVLIKKGAWIGAGAAILPGVTIGKGAIVGANAVVTRDVADFAIVAGVPARVIGDVREKPPVNKETIWGR